MNDQIASNYSFIRNPESKLRTDDKLNRITKFLPTNELQRKAMKKKISTEKEFTKTVSIDLLTACVNLICPYTDLKYEKSK